MQNKIVIGFNVMGLTVGWKGLLLCYFCEIITGSILAPNISFTFPTVGETITLNTVKGWKHFGG